jgi:RNA polymerase sigma-70 factor (ECF subfamily)
LRVWQFRGEPEAPASWLARVAWRRAVDILRGEARMRRLVSAGSEEALVDETDTLSPIRDDELRLIFACCHPVIPAPARIALVLKTLGGFSIEEVARAFLVDVPTMQQRLVRTRHRIAARGLTLELPPASELASRRASVLAAIYLIFNEGYAATRGERLIRPELCDAALRLGLLVAGDKLVGAPEADALMALMLVQAARLDARVDGDGVLVPLEIQDRALWDRDLIMRGQHYLMRSQRGDVVTSYHVQAGIAAVHATASSWAETDWGHLLELYDMLVKIEPTPIVRLNRAIVLAETQGLETALAELDSLAAARPLQRYAALHSARAKFLFRRGDFDTARVAYDKAIGHSATVPERRYLVRQRNEVMCEARVHGR